MLDAERLYIEVRPTGKKIWQFKYTQNGKEGTVSFGEYSIVSLAKARKKNKFKLLDKITKIELILNPGDSLFIPVGWWHYVESLDVSISLTLTNRLLS